MDKMQKKEVSNFGCASFISLIIGVVYLFIGIKYLNISKTNVVNESSAEVVNESITQTTAPVTSMITEDTTIIEESSEELTTTGVSNDYNNDLFFRNYMYMADNNISFEELIKEFGEYETCYYNDYCCWLVFPNNPILVFISPGYSEETGAIAEDSYVIGVSVESRMNFSNEGYEKDIVIGETTVDELARIINRDVDLTYCYYDENQGEVYSYNYYLNDYWWKDAYVAFYFNSDNVIICADYYNYVS